MTLKKNMNKEELFEEGIVKESVNGIAQILISNSDHCEECSAKIYCKPGNSDERTLTVKDPFGVKAGDEVRVSISGRKILQASFFMYGIPLILLIAGIFIGLEIFDTNKELLSTILSAGIISVYALIIYFINKKENNILSSYPEIIFVRSIQ